MKRIPVTINYKAISELKYYKKKYAIKDCKKVSNGAIELFLYPCT